MLDCHTHLTTISSQPHSGTVNLSPKLYFVSTNAIKTDPSGHMQVCSHSLTKIMGSKPVRGMDVCLL
jgi:hypothetical protein